MELSSRVEYALLALLELTIHHAQGEPLKVGEIAASQALPERYLDQILTTLRRAGVVQSQRGAKGGYLLAREPWQITLLDVITSLEGDSCSKKKESVEGITLEKTVVYEVWQQAQAASHHILGRFTLQDLCQKRDSYQQTNPMYYI